jgi:hypothetical protein
MKQPASTASASGQGLGGQLGEMVALLRAGRCGGRILLLIAGLVVVIAATLPDATVAVPPLTPKPAEGNRTVNHCGAVLLPLVVLMLALGMRRYRAELATLAVS